MFETLAKFIQKTVQAARAVVAGQASRKRMNKEMIKISCS
ncbi:hypothetical protein HMPREF1977_0157 [Capnocytophaga ochracea F0287]|uniref:Uncharacterized protein n=1 Tax=Capnocytophaga ochracea F0287 TaxID=873517 RepID=E4MP47_CAPOC|nr:hypothetical protein HMPREF1977_0157 [Capnocytophaga ochracea F0287]EJF43031.1 hypothetical protein HMPREF1319_1933 [Capnocytophaga ochracea str. Holt 25]